MLVAMSYMSVIENQYKIFEILLQKSIWTL